MKKMSPRKIAIKNKELTYEGTPCRKVGHTTKYASNSKCAECYRNIKLSETIGGTTIPDDEDLRILTYKTLLEKFNNKYTKLNLPQKSLLREYINNISNTNSLKDTLREIVKGLKKDLTTHSKNLKDKVVKIKMSEAIKSIDKFCGLNSKTTFVKDNDVLQTLRFMELVKELKKSGQKSVKTKS